nr:putative reverse transcriptase domain-containing protein [Tanacetum cinerariifolium]
MAATLYATAGFPTFAATLVTSLPQPHEPPPPSSYRMGVFVSMFPQGAFGFELEAKGALVCDSNSRLGLFGFLSGTKGCGMQHYGNCPIKCNKCGKIKHKARDCWSKVVATGTNSYSIVTCYGCGEKGHIKTNCPTRNNPGRSRARRQAYALRDGDQNLGPNVVTGTFLLNNRYARVLFDFGSDKSFVNVNFSHLIDIEPVKVGHSYEVELANGKGCALNLVNHLFEIDLMPIELGTFDVIIGMDWLILQDAVIVCGKKEVHMPLKKRTLMVKGDDCVSRLKVVSCMKVKKYVDRGNYLFVAQVVEKEPTERRLKDVPVEFKIELVPGAARVARAPYRLSPSEMKELAKQLQELSNKGYIRPSSSPWGAPVLFVKKKDGSTPPLLPIPLSTPSTSRRSRILEADTPSRNRPLLAIPRPGWKANVVVDALSKKEREKPLRANVVVDALSKKEREKPLRVIVDRLTKSAHLLPKKKTESIKKLGELYLKEIVCRHGVPMSVISDRDRLFTSRFLVSFQKALGTQLDLSIAYHPETDGQSERTIQTLEDMLRACVIDFGSSWDKHFSLVEFSYNNSYHASIKAAPFEALYGRKCRSLVCWSEVGESQLTGPELVRETTKNIVQIKNRLLTARSRQKSYADLKRRLTEFEVCDKVMLEVSQWRGVIRFGKRGKLSPRYIGPFKVIERIRPVAYKLELPDKLRGIYDTFHVCNLKRCFVNDDVVIPLDEIEPEDKLYFVKKLVEIMDREVKRLKQSRISIVKVCWNSRRGLEFTWEREDFFRSKIDLPVRVSSAHCVGLAYNERIPCRIRDVAGLFDFINTFDPFKVKFEEWTLAEVEVSLLKETEKRVIPPFDEIITIVDHAIADELKDTAIDTGKTLKKLVTLGTLKEKIGYGSASDAMTAFISEYITPSPTQEYQDESDVTPLNMVIVE